MKIRMETIPKTMKRNKGLLFKLEKALITGAFSFS